MSLGTNANGVDGVQPLLTSFCLPCFDGSLRAAPSVIYIAPDCPSLYAINLSPPLPPLPHPALSLAHTGEAKRGRVIQRDRGRERMTII